MTEKKYEYDAVPYVSQTIPNTSPEHLSLCAIWNGWPNPLHENFKYIELGCGIGTNLLALAYYHPNALFVGIDNSLTQIETAQNGVHALQLSNVEFRHLDIRELNKSNFDVFDFIVVHGVFSWVPEDTRSEILTFCQHHLSQTGLTYISYNTMPGWATRGIVRDALLRHPKVRNAPIHQKAQMAIEVSQHLLTDLPFREYAYGALLESELKRVPDCKPSYILHEYLEPTNTPFWLSDFVSMAGKHDLQYITDAQFCREEGQCCHQLSNLENVSMSSLEQEETLDLLCHRYFRASILSLKEVPPTPIDRTVLMEDVFIAGVFQCKSEPFVLDDGVAQYLESYEDIVLNESITKAAILILCQRWPDGMRLSSLFRESTELLTKYNCTDKENNREILASELIEMFEAGHIEIRLTPSYNATHAIENSDFPNASPLARFEARNHALCTTAHHASFPTGPHDPKLLELADGTRTFSEIRRIHADFGERLQELHRWGFVTCGNC